MLYKQLAKRIKLDPQQQIEVATVNKLLQILGYTTFEQLKESFKIQELKSSISLGIPCMPVAVTVKAKDTIDQTNSVFGFDEYKKLLKAPHPTTRQLITGLTTSKKTKQINKLIRWWKQVLKNSPLTEKLNQNAEISELITALNEAISFESQKNMNNFLFDAVKRNKPDEVTYLLDSGANVDSYHEKFNVTCLFKASQDGLIDIVEQLLKAGADPNISSELPLETHPSSTTVFPLDKAVEKGHLSVVSALLGANAKISSWIQNQLPKLTQKQFYPSPLNDKEKIKAFLRLANSTLPLTVIPSLLKMNPKEIFQVLNRPDIPLPKEVLSYVNSKGWTALHLASYYGYPNTASKLINAGSDVNLEQKNGVTPLHLATQKGHKELVKILLAHNDPNQAITEGERKGLTPLHLAANKGHKEVIKILLAHKVDPNQAITEGEHKGFNTLHLAANKGHKEVIKTLLAHKADPNQAITEGERKGLTPLHLAANKGHKEVIKILLAHKADPNQAITEGKCKGICPLYVASKFSHLDSVKELLTQEGIDVNASAKNCVTPLYWAVKNGHKDIVRLLLAQESIDVNAADKHGRTPLHWSVQNEDKDIVELLLDQEANIVTETTINKLTPLDLALKKKCQPIIKILNKELQIQHRKQAEALVERDKKIATLEAQVAKLQAEKIYSILDQTSQSKRKVSQSNLPNKKAKQKGEIPAAAAE